MFLRRARPVVAVSPNGAMVALRAAAIPQHTLQRLYARQPLPQRPEPHPARTGDLAMMGKGLGWKVRKLAPQGLAPGTGQIVAALTPYRRQRHCGFPR